MNMLQCRGLSKRYPSQKRNAVDMLDLDVAGGEIFGFLGPNGAGKSTTIKMIVGLLEADSGTVSLDGLDLVSSPIEYKRMIGYCPDEPLFYEKMTGLAHLGFIADIHGLDEATRKERITTLSEQLLLVDELADPISTYSHGMRQKLSVIAALLHSPKLLILDEPMVGLDPKASYNLKELIKSYAALGKLVFFSTHVLEVAQNLCTKLGIIEEGKLRFNGTFSELQQMEGSEAQSLETLFLRLTEDRS